MAKKVWMGTIYGAGKTSKADRNRLEKHMQTQRQSRRPAGKGWRGDNR